MQCVLVEMIATERLGKPVYFEDETAIGPCCTSNWNKAMKFESRQEAMSHPAYLFCSASFEPIDAETETDVWEALTVPENAK